ncbi:GNAT family N-acetyltransferase [Protaetiibacter intestinalis]|uniref:GNAT family N-acetyltransferase n=1 Tax=Protaetiibacter intestinalis TaxID=2419774 RepID=A0A387B4Q8_9MICO|nr:GNAT family N-acetyltransferase [Protaetiibacter intestinalis]AYF98572.1 GNAT family N-acetyltransferase [Protaetiibacter intestinalis]
MGGLRVEEVPLPAAIDGSAAAVDFAATVDIRNLVEEAGYGTVDVRVTPERLLGYFTNPFEPHRLFVAREDGRVVARGLYETLADPDSPVCWLDVRVHPAHRRRGVGTAVAAQLEALARAEGRTHAIVYIVSPEGPGPRLPSPTGSGSLPADNPEVRFLRGRGYRLEQVVRASRLPLPLDAGELAVWLHAARDRTGEGYCVHRWEGVTPERFRDDMAVLLTRMSTDAPQGALDEPEDVWTAERVAEHETRTTADGAELLTSAVEHLGTGRLVGFTQLGLPADRIRPVDQFDTLVLREHRGHALGMLLKLENLAALQSRHPGRPSVLTWNADENRHMLAVNEQLGFTPMGYEGAWRLDL